MTITIANRGDIVRHWDTGKIATVVMGTQDGRIVVRIANDGNPYNEVWERYCAEVLSTREDSNGSL